MFGIITLVSFIYFVFSFFWFLDTIDLKTKRIIIGSWVCMIFMCMMMIFTYEQKLYKRYKVVSVEESTVPIGAYKGQIRHIVKTTNGIFVINPDITEYELNGENIFEVYISKCLFMRTGSYKYVLKK